MISVKKFQQTIWDFYKKNGRHDLPWRKTRDPYKIWVSEIMLQQTQVSRVIPKYDLFLKKFPTVQALAKAKQQDVLEAWQGLGYNRRGLNLKKAAEIVAKQGTIPFDPLLLQELPGIGYYTASAIVTFSKDKPLFFIETNIRTVFISFFFQSREKVDDKEIMEKIEKTFPDHSPRDWYYALMDYGSMLKQQKGSRILHRKSSSYAKQSAFKGSGREVRSAILKYMLRTPTSSISAVKASLPFSPQVIEEKLKELVAEGFLAKKGKKIVLR